MTDNYNVYKNPKSGKYYTWIGEGEEREIITVFVADTIYNAATPRVDKNGKLFKVLPCTESKTKSGFKVLKCK